MRTWKCLCVFPKIYERFLGNMRDCRGLCVFRLIYAHLLQRKSSEINREKHIHIQNNPKSGIHSVFWLISGNHDTIVSTHFNEEIDNKEKESIDWTEELMMQDQSKKITYGAMMLALFTIFLAGAMYIPFLGSIIMIFIPLPIILYRLRYNRSSTIFVMIVGSILSVIIGGILLVPFALMFGILAFLIAESLLLGKSKLYTFMASGLFFIVTSVLVYVVAALVFEINVIDSLMAMMKESETQFKNSLQSFGALPEGYEKIVEEAFTMYRSAIPAIFILSVYLFTFIMVIPNFEVLRRLGHQVPKFPPFRDMKLPVITIFIYGLIILLPWMMELKPESSAYLLYINATIILRVLLLLQGLSLVHYFMYKMKMPGVVTMFATIFALLFSPITTLLGILDIGVNIRAWIGKDNSK